MCWFLRDEYFNCGRGCHKVGMCQNQTSATAHRSEVLQDDARRRFVVFHFQRPISWTMAPYTFPYSLHRITKEIEMIFTTKTNDSIDRRKLDCKKLLWRV